MTQVRARVAASTVPVVIDRERFPPHRAFRAREDEGSTLGASGAENDAPPRGDDATEAVTSITAADAGGDAAASPNGLGDPTKSLGDPS
jgi:hypothetical protein